MNLIQLQERLKDVPLQAVMGYANGQNPTVPPYMALAELKRRESVSQSAQSQQDMQKGQQPSIKEQVEQAAGLASLQKQMQAQGLQSLMQAQGGQPQPIPGDVPQPQQQPQEEGVASLPTGEMYNFRNGGIVAFQGGGTTPIGRFASGIAEKIGGVGSKIAANYQEEQEKAELQKAIREELQSKSGIRGAFTPQTAEQYDEAGQLVRAAMNPEANAETLRWILATAKQLNQPQEAPPITQAAPIPEQSGMAGVAAPLLVSPESVMAPMRRGVEDQGTQQRAAAMGTSQRARPQQQGGIAGIEGADEARKMMLGAMRDQATPESIYAEQQKLAGLYGLAGPQGAERMARIEQMQAAREKALESRPQERLMRALATRGGLAGLGRGYLSAVEGERIADQRFRQQMDEMLGGVEQRRREEAAGQMGSTQLQMGERRKTALGAAEEINKAELQRRRDIQRAKDERALAILRNEARAEGQAAPKPPRSDRLTLEDLRKEYSKLQSDPMNPLFMKAKINNFDDFVKYKISTGVYVPEGESVNSGTPDLAIVNKFTGQRTK